MKRFTSFLFASMLMISTWSVTHAATYPPIEVTIDGVRQNGSPSGVLVQGTAMVPMRTIFEKLGAAVDWQASAETVTAKKDGTAIQLTLGGKKALKDGKEIALSVPAQSVNGSTMVPLRFVSEALGGTVQWEEETNTAHIESAEAAADTIAVPEAYAPVLRELAAEKGILTEDHELMSDTTGVAYVDFIDFDNDLTDELYVVYADFEEGDYARPFYKEEVWSSRGGEAYLVYEQEFSNGGLIDDAARSIATAEGRSYLVESGSYSAGSRGRYQEADEYGSWHVFYEMKNGSFVEVDAVIKTEIEFGEDSGREDMVLYASRIDGTETDITKQKFDAILQSYRYREGDRIIGSSAGAKGLEFDVEASAGRIAKMLQGIGR